MAMKTSVFEMVHQVLGDAKEKLARDASTGVEKKAAAVSQRSAKTPVETKLSDEYLGKLASACDHLSTHLHLIDQVRTPQEKLAEYAEVSRALMKKAFEGGDAKHQTTEADSDSVSPHSVSLNDSGTGVGAGNAIPSSPATTPGANPAEASGQGEASSGNQPPKGTSPTEKPNPMDAANAMETNLGMMMPEQPADLLQQAGGTEANGKTASARALRTISKATGHADATLREKAASAKRSRVLMLKAAQAGIPPKVAQSLLRKMAGDEENPAHIEAGSDPLLQSEPGVPSVLSQGAEAGSNTPRGTAPTSGEGGGRELISSNEAAMNATKGQAKHQNRGALSELLTEPMHSSAHDKTLHESLDNTSSAGVKISAARELLKKLAASSPDARRMVAALVKKADETAAMPAAPMMEEAAPAAAPAGDAGTMDAALAAVLAGVTPEDLAAAEGLLAGEAGGGAEAPVAEEGAAPEAGAEAPEKLQEFGMGGPSGGAVGTPPSPTPMMG